MLLEKNKMDSEPKLKKPRIIGMCFTALHNILLRSSPIIDGSLSIQWGI